MKHVWWIIVTLFLLLIAGQKSLAQVPVETDHYIAFDRPVPRIATPIPYHLPHNPEAGEEAKLK